MKKFEKTLALLMLVIGVTFFYSCSDDKDEPDGNGTTYTITVTSNANELAGADGLTAKCDYELIEYNDANQVVNTQFWYDIPDGKSTKTFTANQQATKLVIKFNLYAYKDGRIVGEDSRYYAYLYYLKVNGNFKITLNGDSNVIPYNPIEIM